jgi:hypothetical protein
MTNNHMTRNGSDATHAANPQAGRRGPRVRRVAVLRPGRTGVRLVSCAGGLAARPE